MTKTKGGFWWQTSPDESKDGFFCHQCLSSMWERRESPNHVRNHLKIIPACWNAVLVSGRLAECEQVLCKHPAQPCLSVTPSLRAGGAYLCPCLMCRARNQDWEGLGKAAGTCAGRGYSGKAGGVGPIGVCGCNLEQVGKQMGGGGRENGSVFLRKK